MLTDHEFITLSEKTQCPVHLTSKKVQGNLPPCSHTEESRVKKHFPTEKAFPQDIKRFKEKTLYSGSLIRKKLRDWFLKNNHRDHLLAEAKSEILKQECNVVSLNTPIREFRRHARSNRLEMDCKLWNEESRREQARFHKELLAQREKALRDTRIRNIHEVEELKRSQEMRMTKSP